MGSCNNGSSGPSPKTSLRTSSVMRSFSSRLSGVLSSSRSFATAARISPRTRSPPSEDRHLEVDPLQQLAVESELQFLVLGRRGLDVETAGSPILSRRTCPSPRSWSSSAAKPSLQKSRHHRRLLRGCGSGLTVSLPGLHARAAEPAPPPCFRSLSVRGPDARTLEDRKTQSLFSLLLRLGPERPLS